MLKSPRSAFGLLQFTIGGTLFLLLATANGAGYRYGVSDQAFYIPVVTRALDPSLFPRDGALIDAEGRLMVADEMLAGIVRGTDVPLPMLFFVGYVVSVALLWTALVLIGTRVYRHAWAVVALAAAFAMRHRIPRTSANSFEPYFHPRMLAFGVGALAVAALLRGRRWLAIGLVAVSSLVHITTGLWFAVLVGVALAVLDRRWRRLAAIGVAVAAVALMAAVTVGPLRGSLAVMDATWLQAVASKDSLFATDWPVWAWAANLGLLALLWWAHRTRVRRAAASDEDRALVWGATALVALFLVTLPLVTAKLSLAVQFQISRVFWLVDFIALIYVVGAVIESDHNRPPRRTHQRNTVRTTGVVAAILLLVCSAARGGYVMLIERPERALFETGLPESAWEDAMRWIATRPTDVQVLADPGHAWKYGTSVRVSAERDVLLEEVKDSALAIYSRTVAASFVERSTAVGDFSALTADKARDLAQRYQLDYLITEADLPLPSVYRNGEFHIYALR
ncbi:MAG: hypothetical protein ACRD3C_16355 [Vicinamibacterales bacterium]